MQWIVISRMDHNLKIIVFVVLHVSEMLKNHLLMKEYNKRLIDIIDIVLRFNHLIIMLILTASLPSGICLV